MARLFDTITPAPPDPILGLTEAFKEDPNPDKINLGVGVYADDEGRTPVLRSVKTAEEALLREQTSKSYLPIAGAPEFGRNVQDLLMGEGHPVTGEGRARTAHTPGGTGALRVGAELLRRFAPKARAWLSAPTWANHRGIFEAAGFEVKEYAYYHPMVQELDYGHMLKALRRVPAGDIVVLHVCCHNPTGVDPTDEQWKAIAEAAGEQQWIPFLDFAYQGLADGLEGDREGLLRMLEAETDLFVASSFSKNFGLYQERTGALTLVAHDAKAADAAFSYAKRVIRVLYSNPPGHGGSIVSRVLGDRELRALWETEVAGIRERIARVRAALVEGLRQRGSPVDFSFIAKQKGMFSFSGLSEAQVEYLREKKSIYIVRGGRINVVGVPVKKLDYLCDAIIEALKARPAE